MKHGFFYTVEDLRKRNLIIFEARMGSHAYGTSLPTSDIDLRGVFIQPLGDILKYGHVDQVADKLNDIIYYELRRFLDLVEANNPNIIEILYAPKDVTNIKHEYFKLIEKHKKKFLTKRCRHTFAGYAIDQIKKARGYNKKMNWEESQMVRKGVLEFCYILVDGQSKLFRLWLEDNYNTGVDQWTQKDFGLAKVDHAHDVYALYQLPHENAGIVSDPANANDVQLWSIPKGNEPVAYLTFNKDAYSTHCKRYNEYQTWLKERNPDRVKMNKDHGKNYDSKNMMHTFRLLKVALEIADTGKMNVRRSPEEIEVLMKIRHGEYEYDKLVMDAENMIADLDRAYDESKLPEKSDPQFILDLQLHIRKEAYDLRFI